MDASRDARQNAGTSSDRVARLRSVARLLIIDVVAPLIAYSQLRSAGISKVAALVLSGVFPAVGVAIDAIRHRRLEVVGALVLAGILVGSLLGLITHNARLVLMEGSVPTAMFGLACLGSLWTQSPLMFAFAIQFIGRDTARGREMLGLWQYDGFRQIFRVITAVWGVAFLVEAALRVVIVYNTSTGTALALSKVMTYAFVAVFLAWTIAYGRYRGRKGQRMMAAAAATAAAAEEPGTTGTESPPADMTKTAEQA